MVRPRRGRVRHRLAAGWRRIAIVGRVPSARPALLELPADDAERALRFWSGILGEALLPRSAAQGRGWQTASEEVLVGVHERGTGPGDTVSLPYFEVRDIALALGRVSELGGTIVHPGERWAICRDSEGSPFALAAAGEGAA